MELKSYQQSVIDDLQNYLNLLNNPNLGSLNTIFETFWREHRYPLISPPKYQNHIHNVPNVCVKVPTAGGKTFIAVNSLQPIFNAIEFYGNKRPKMVVWLVPSESILSQILKNLRDISHPYRQKLNAHFGGASRVQILDKEQVLRGQNFDADSVQQGISIVVMSFSSLKLSKKDIETYHNNSDKLMGKKRNEKLRAYRENSNLDTFTVLGGTDLLSDYDKTSLINVLRSLNPVLIVDESHHTTTPLSHEMLNNLNPSFILELTATPKDTSNIISYVNAHSLKQEQMVKLPVIVSKQHSQADVMMSALTLRANLENIAQNAKKSHNAPYVRPIILFQAEPKTKDDNATFAHIKNELLKIGIPENQIAIKTSEINELKNVDLLSKECEIRFVITVNALKEGWDCPFAYILASLANKSSVVDVTQIVGRVLRQPYAQNHPSPILNASFVFTASDKFDETLQSVVKGLNMAGFSEDDYRLATPSEAPPQPTPSNPTDDLFSPQNQNIEENKDDVILPQDFVFRQPEQTQNAVFENNPVAQMVETLQNQASQIAQNYQEKTAQNKTPLPNELQGKTNMAKMRDEFVCKANELKLPQFFIKAELSDLFKTDNKLVLLDKANLLMDLKLAGENCNIDFGNISETVYQGDIDENGMVQFQPLKGRDKKQLTELFANYSDKSQQDTLVQNLFDLGKKSFYPIGDDDVKNYFRRVVEQMSGEQRQHCFANIHQYFNQIKTKINQISNEFAEKEFNKRLDIYEIILAPSFVFPTEISPSEFATPLVGSLYDKEGKISTFESKVLQRILNHDDIHLAFWHRNLEKKGFYINAFLNHYPDFILLTQQGTMVLLETKGNQLDGSDSQAKIRAGKLWEQKANAMGDGRKYKYLMVFETEEKLAGAYSVAEMLDRLKNW